MDRHEVLESFIRVYKDEKQVAELKLVPQSYSTEVHRQAMLDTAGIVDWDYYIFVFSYSDGTKKEGDKQDRESHDKYYAEIVA